MAPRQFSRAFVLRSVDQGESNRVLTLFTEEFGKIAGIARGARQSGRRQLRSLQPFTLLTVALHEGRGELFRIEEARVQQIYPHVFSDLGRMDIAGHVLATLRSILPERHPERALFADLVVFLERLDGECDALEEIALVFLKHALALLGHEPRFDQCGHCGRRPRATQPVRFDATLGALVCSHCGHARHELHPRARALLCSNWLSEAQSSRWLQSRDELIMAQETLSAFAQAQFGRMLPTRMFQDVPSAS